MKKAVFLVLSLSAFFWVSCGGGGGNPPPPVTISISPTSPTVGGANTQQFTATVGNTSNTAVTWQVEGISGGNATVGTISATGLYTAPFFMPANATVSVTAVAQADTSKSASATITIVFSNAMLIGQYAFSYIGWELGPSFFTIAGSISANGNGAITGGVSDLNNSFGVFPELTLAGTYTVSADGLVEILLTDSQPASYTLRAVMVSPDHLRVIQFDTTSTGQGSIDWQDPAAFNDAAFAGGYAFRLDGYGFTGYAAGIAGRMTADNAGNLTAGVMDINENFIDTNADVFTGTYTTIDANGRGEITLDTNQGPAVFAFYIASSGKVHLISIDSIGLPWMLGVAEKQTPGFFSNANLSGDYAYFFSGYSTTDIYYSVGRFTANGSGGVSAGVSDENDSGLTTENLAFTGTYSVDAIGDGRGTGTFTSTRGPSTFSFYMVSPSRAFFVQQGTFALGTGEVDAQTGGPYTNASLAGNFGFSMDGYPSMLVGQFDAAGGTASGTVNLTTFDNTGSVLTLTPDQAFNATYSVTANGRGDFTVTGIAPITFHTYMISGSKVHLIGMSDVFLGMAEKQF